MQDTSIKGNGTSRFIKGASNFPSSFEEFRRQIMAGTLTADIGLNPAGCDVVGTALSKANLLTDDVANRLGLAESKTVNEALNKLFTFAADGKKNCAAAVSAMGVQTSPDASFATIADNIKKIETGSDVSGVTAKEEDVRSTKTFVASDGILKSGSLVTRKYEDITQRIDGSIQVKIPYGIYDQGMGSTPYMVAYVKDSKLLAENIRNGVTIFGKTGNYKPYSAYTFDCKISMSWNDWLITFPGLPSNKSISEVYALAMWVYDSTTGKSWIIFMESESGNKVKLLTTDGGEYGTLDMEVESRSIRIRTPPDLSSGSVQHASICLDLM